jgi:hypothetical protein
MWTRPRAQREIRPGKVFSADFVRNVQTRYFLGVDENQKERCPLLQQNCVHFRFHDIAAPNDGHIA